MIRFCYRLGPVIGAILLSAPVFAEITVDNFAPGEQVHYPVVMLRGHSAGDVIGVGADRKNAVRFPVVKGEYRAIYELKPGANMVLLFAGKDSVKLRIDYAPPTTPLKVLTVWAKGKDEPEGYKSALPGDPLKIREKLDVSMKLLQCFYAEAMNDAGYGRKTFPLEFDKAGKVVVHVIELPKTGEEMRAMENNASWGYIYGQLAKQFPEDGTKWCTMLGFSGYDPATQKAPGHYALGGGSLGAFGTNTLMHWPTSFKEVGKVLIDTTLVDTTKMLDDSAYRKTVWSNVSTAWGAIAHEMGHTFGLPHSNDPYSVMSRGFDYFSRTFVVEEAPQARQTSWVAVKPDEHSRWDAYSAAKLNWNPYLQPAAVAKDGSPEPTITIEGDEITIKAPAGIRVWGADRDDVTAFFEQTREGTPATEKKLSRKELREKMGGKLPYRITVVDSLGRQRTIEDHE